MTMQNLGHGRHSQKAGNLGILDKIERKLKIVFLGSGSMFFKNLFIDILNMPGADTGEINLVDIDTKRLRLSKELAEKIVGLTNKKWTVNATDKRVEVLCGADYVINCIEVSGVKCVSSDYEIPAKYGVDQCIGDTIGPGGLFKALRTAPIFLSVLKDIERFCPEAYVLNYTNPMSILCLAGSKYSWVKLIGLCHSVQHTSHQIAAYMSIPYEELHWQCAGINHLSWFLRLSHKNKNVYPKLFEVAKRSDVYEEDPIRFDMMKYFGYFVTESSGHLSEYVPYYRKRKELVEKYCRKEFNGDSGFYSRNWPVWRQEQDNQRAGQISGEENIDLDRSWEYAGYIVQAIETNSPFVIHATVPNAGLISNLPTTGVVEVPCLVDRNGIQPIFWGSLPEQCAAICSSNMRMFELAAAACVEKSIEAALYALLLDPLTAAVCSPEEIKNMFHELYSTQKAFLQNYQ